MALQIQAKTQQDYRQQLLAKKEEFEAAIRNYQGDDPLEPYYNYIAWMEQNYPKSGHKDNCKKILDHCLPIFEDDPRYTNDRRFCKLWIKFIDFCDNPKELYLLMKSRNLCTGCADYYKAWAYYYEAAEDFEEAYNILEEGKKNLAQPYEDLEIAQRSLCTSVSEARLRATNPNRLKEKREALTSLHTVGSGRVGSVRVPSSHFQGDFGHSSAGGHLNTPVNSVYTDQPAGPSKISGTVPPSSIVTSVKIQEATEENTLATGPLPPQRKRRKPKPKSRFAISEEDSLLAALPHKDKEEFSWFDRIPLTLAEVMFPHQIRCYRKDLVYREYCFEEIEMDIRSQNVQNQRGQGDAPIPTVIVSDLEDERILDDDDDEEVQEVQPPERPKPQFEVFSEDHQNFLQDVFNRSNEPGLSTNKNPDENANNGPSPMKSLQAGFSNVSGSRTPNGIPPSKIQAFRAVADVPSPSTSKANNFMMTSPQPVNNPDTSAHRFDIHWSSSVEDASPQQSSSAACQLKFVKTYAFRELTVDELVETGSRHGGAMADQPTDEAKNIEDDEMDGGNDYLNASCNTQQFNFNLNTMQISTPQARNKSQSRNMDAQNCRQSLSNETAKIIKPLSIIMEETKSSYGSSSSSSSGATTKSMISSQHKMSTISEEHTANLQQNLMANAELRRSLLGLIDDDLPVPVVHAPPAPLPQQPELPPPHDESLPLLLAKGQPIGRIPTDPFKPSLLENLLERVNFPGVHSEGFVPIEGCPRITSRQDPIYISGDQYVIEKQLGKGMFGTVYKAFDCRRQSYVALKLQKPPNKWEFYICRELAARLQNHELRDRFMNISIGYFSSQCSILVSKYEPFGSLLDLVNVLKVNGTRTKEPLCFYITLEMLRIVKAMHEVKIIHADIKPDNFLVVLQDNNTVKLQLIDFGCSIDMSLFPHGATFRKKIVTDNFVCCEVLDGRPWSYHTDLFCIAASAHVLLFNEYIEMRKVDGAWSISARLPRYCKIDLWNMFFSSLLNQQSGPADVATLELLFREQVEGPCKKDLPSQMRHVVNLLKKR